nr:diguanylate cyclase [uncultured Paraglaciecola sp.]
MLEIIDQLPIAVFAKDPKNDFKFVIWNKKMASMFDVPSDNIIGITDFELFDDIEAAKKFRKIDEEVMAQGRVVDIQEVVTAAKGDITCHTLKLPLKLADGRELLVGMLDDITDDSANKKQLEAYRNDLELLVEKRTAQLQALANTDSLTGLGNRNFFIAEIKELIKGRDRSVPFSVMFIDLNGFKLLNDSYGHRLGDELLREMGKRLYEFNTHAPIVARLGGMSLFLQLSREKSTH